MIIILAAIVIFTGLNTPDRAQLAKFTQEFSGFQEAVTNSFLNEKMKLSTSGQYRTDEQIYYKIATGTDTQETPTPTGKVSELGFTTSPEPIQGQNYYKITQAEVEGLKPQQMFSAAGGDLYITDKGEAFVLPGYLVEENGTNRWYVSASKYHDGEEVSGSGGGGGDTPVVNEEDLQGLYAYFVTSGMEFVDGSIDGYSDNDYLYDAHTIEWLGYSNYLFYVDEVEHMYDFILYHENYYKLTSYYDGVSGNSYYSNVEAITYSSSLSNLGKMEKFFVDLQFPIGWNGEDNILIDLPPVTDATTDLICVVKDLVYDYHGVKYLLTFKDTDGSVESVTVLSTPSVSPSEYLETDGAGTITGVKAEYLEVNSNAHYGATIYCPFSTIEIPSTIGSETITAIDEWAFSHYGNLNTVIIPNTVTSIGMGAFQWSTITTITIPSSVTSIGNQIFADCEKLTNVTIENGVTSILDYMFKFCDHLVNVTIPSSVTSIEAHAFSCCYALSSITIPSDVTTIDNTAFEDCTSLISVTIDSSTVAAGLTSQTAQGELIYRATTIYIKDNITSVGSYVTSNYTKQSTSDKAGYDKYVKN